MRCARMTAGSLDVSFCSHAHPRYEYVCPPPPDHPRPLFLSKLSISCTSHEPPTFTSSPICYPAIRLLVCLCFVSFRLPCCDSCASCISPLSGKFDSVIVVINRHDFARILGIPRSDPNRGPVIWATRLATLTGSERELGNGSPSPRGIVI